MCVIGDTKVTKRLRILRTSSNLGSCSSRVFCSYFYLKRLLEFRKVVNSLDKKSFYVPLSYLYSSSLLLSLLFMRHMDYFRSFAIASHYCNNVSAFFFFLNLVSFIILLLWNAFYSVTTRDWLFGALHIISRSVLTGFTFVSTLMPLSLNKNLVLI